MPTGYTQKLVDGDQTFAEFALTCARAFGACIELRDESLSKEIPVFSPGEYHVKAREKAEKVFTDLSAMKRGARIKYGQKKRIELVQSAQDYTAKREAENLRMEAMIDNVEAWVPPTPEHTNMKKFMLDQLKISLHDLSYWRDQVAENLAKKPLSFYKADLEEAERSIKYHTQKYKEECERVERNNRWVSDLRNSL